MNIVVHQGEITKTMAANENETILSVLQKNGIHISAPCGGGGTCGKCKVTVAGMGEVLACQTKVQNGMDVTLPQSLGAEIVTGGVKSSFALDPAVQSAQLSLTPPGLHDPADHLARVLREIGPRRASAAVLRKLAPVLEQNAYRATAIYNDEVLLDVCPPDGGARYGFAVDIGTTTVVCYLVNLSTGETEGVRSAMNAQATFGADVIARIQKDGETGGTLLNEAICRQLGEMMQSFEIDRVYEAVIVGNTTMLHFLLGANAASIALSPFTASFLGAQTLLAEEIGLPFAGMRVHLLPGASAYVGADITAAALAANMEDGSVLIDIGTNGEMCLYKNGRYICCATAAGPAFEGGNIACGMAGVRGAICKVGADFTYETIGGAKAAGICGSGLVDAVAALLAAGHVDETGYLDDEFEDGFPLCDGVLITAKDIREMQLAKAAISAGVDCMLDAANMTYAGVSHLYLAGGFGSKINIKSAAAIGLFPKELEPVTVAIGNGAGMGALACLTSRAARRAANEIADKMDYIELSASKLFQEKYVENMMFEN